MGSWLYRWEDGTVSFVSAPTRLDAAVLLDEIGAASPGRLQPVPEGFFVTYRPKKKRFEWEEDDRGENLHHLLDDLHGKRPPAPEKARLVEWPKTPLGQPSRGKDDPGAIPGPSSG